jgi:hypothetical protein
MGFTSDKKKELMEIDRLFESINDFSLRKQTLNEFNRTQVSGMGKNLTYIDNLIGSSKPSIDLPKVNKDLIKDINTAAEKSGVEVSITTAKTGHGPGGRHGKYEAVDIAVINNKGFPDEKTAINNGIHDDIKRFVDELVKMGYKKNVESMNDKSVLTFGFPGHSNHIHVSRKFGAGQSVPSDTEQMDTDHITQQDIDSLEKVADQTNMDFDDLLRKASEGEKIDVQSWVKQNFGFLDENKKIKKRTLKTQENINRIKNLLK